MRDDLAKKLAQRRAARSAAEGARGDAPSPAGGTTPPPPPQAPPGAPPEGGDPPGVSRGGPGVRQCRSCGAAIRWDVTEGGSRVPLDAEPVEIVTFKRLELAGVAVDPAWRREPVLYVPHALVKIEKKSARRAVITGGVVLEASVHPELPRIKGHRSHFVTCPHADEWRARRS